MTRSSSIVACILLFLSGILHAQSNQRADLGSILDSEGKIKSGISGSFDASGYEMKLGPSGEPVFTPGNKPSSPESTIEWNKLTSGIGAEGSASQKNTYIYEILVIGTDIYIGGQFRSIQNTRCNGIARWNGTSWNAVGTGVDGYLQALAHDGTNLYAAGSFTTAGGTQARNVAMWNGSSWSALGNGLNSNVYDLEIFKGKLYAGGYFTGSGETIINKIAAWNGSDWEVVGTNMTRNIPVYFVYSLEATSEILYCGGSFGNIGGVTVANIAAWNGLSWSALGSGVNGAVRCLLYQSGTLYAGGSFSVSGTTTLNRIGKWDESSWHALGTGANGAVNAIVADGPYIYVGGSFNSIGGVSSSLAKWTGSSWVSVGGKNLTSGGVNALLIKDNWLYAAGDFVLVGSDNFRRVAKFDGVNWYGFGEGIQTTVSALAHDGTYLYAGGGFTTAGTTPANNVAKWNGSAWLDVGSNLDAGVNFILPSWHYQAFIVGGKFISFDQTSISKRIAKFTDSDNPLPVELTSFSGSFINGAVLLNWQTATEVDNYGFEIERKDASSGWQKIGFNEGHGTSNSPKYYSFADNTVIKGNRYSYRL